MTSPIRHGWTVVCSRALQDRETNALALIDCFDELGLAGAIDVEQFPTTVPFSAAVVSYWLRQNVEVPCEGNVRMVILGPDGDALGEATGKIDLASHDRFRTIIRMNAFPIGGEGIHEIVVSHANGEDWQEDHRFPLRVRVSATPGTASSGS